MSAVANRKLLKPPTPLLPVLLVEDDAGDEALALRAFRLAGVEPPVVARDGAEAVDLLQECPNFSLVLLDIKLPKKSGFEVLRVIRSMPATRSIPVIMLSSSDVQIDIDTSYRLGASSFVTKPVGFNEYLTTLRGLLNYWTRVGA